MLKYKSIHNYPFDRKHAINVDWFRCLNENELKIESSTISVRSYPTAIMNYMDRKYNKTIKINDCINLRNKIIKGIYGFFHILSDYGSFHQVIEKLISVGKSFSEYNNVSNEVSWICFSTLGKIGIWKWLSDSTTTEWENIVYSVYTNLKDTVTYCSSWL